MSEKKYKCPYCEQKFDRNKLIGHVSKAHDRQIPQGYTATRIVFNIVNNKDTGHCVVCKSETKWNEKTGKYDRLCGDPKCTKALRDNALKNHIRVYGTSTLLNDPMHQELMLANRKISGEYTFSDGTKRTYTGSYEKKCLEFFDKVLEARGCDVITPGPVLEYKFKGQLKKYITDIYYVPYNLIIECKDGGDNPNNRQMEEYREKTIAKEAMITSNGVYNYLRLTNNNFGQLLEIMAELKMNLIDNDYSKVIRVNENSSSSSEDAKYGEFKDGACMLTILPSDDSEETEFMIANNSLDKVIKIDDDSIKVHKYPDSIRNKNIKVYEMPKNWQNRLFIGDATGKNLYELVSEHQMLCEDQIDYDAQFKNIKFNNLDSKKSIIETTMIEEYKMFMRENFEIPVCDIQGSEYRSYLRKSNILSEDCDIFTDLNGFFCKNNDTGFRTKSYDDIEDIPQDDIMLIGKLKSFFDENLSVDSITNPGASLISNLELPFFTPEELIDFGYYDGEGNRLYDSESDIYDGFSAGDWFKSYDALYNGVYNEDFKDLYDKWIRSLSVLQNKLDVSYIRGDINEMNEIKEEMISIGWNPVMNFDSKNREISSSRVKNKINNNLLTMENLCESEISEKIDKNFNPIYITLIGNTSVLSKAIKKITNSDWSHSAIGFESDLKKLFSFNANYHGQTGFSEESITGYDKNCDLSVFVVFVSDKMKKKCIDIVKDFKKNKSKSKYSFKQILAIPFNKALNIDYQMICSQFVDSLLKLANVNFNKKESGVTVPGDLYDSATFSNKCYNVFQGKIKDYDSKSVLKRLNIMHDTIGIASESTIEEARSLPIKMNSDGDLLIRNSRIMTPSDFETEFARSHKILLTAEKSNNIETMKYEVAKLWFLNLTIENKLKSRTTKNTHDDFNKARAKILNDFSKYLKVIQEKDDKFVFGKYYEDSEFNIYETKIDNKSIQMTINTIYDLLKPRL
jgi:hypothetical protein